MALKRLRQLGFERRTAARGAEGPIAGGAAGAARDLRQFGRIEPTELIAVEFAIGSEGYVVDVEIETHADCVGGYQVIDIAGLVQRNLRVAGARRERAQNDGRAAALTADQFGDRVDLLGREGDNRGAAWKPRDLLFARKGQLRQPRPRQYMGAWQKPLDHRPHRLGTQYQRLLATAAVEHAIGK